MELDSKNKKNQWMTKNKMDTGYKVRDGSKGPR